MKLAQEFEKNGSNDRGRLIQPFQHLPNYIYLTEQIK